MAEEMEGDVAGRLLSILSEGDFVAPLHTLAIAI